MPNVNSFSKYLLTASTEYNEEEKEILRNDLGD